MQPNTFCHWNNSLLLTKYTFCFAVGLAFSSCGGGKRILMIHFFAVTGCLSITSHFFDFVLLHVLYINFDICDGTGPFLVSMAIKLHPLGRSVFTIPLRNVLAEVDS